MVGCIWLVYKAVSDMDNERQKNRHYSTSQTVKRLSKMTPEEKDAEKDALVEKINKLLLEAEEQIKKGLPVPGWVADWINRWETQKEKEINHEK